VGEQLGEQAPSTVTADAAGAIHDSNKTAAKEIVRNLDIRVFIIAGLFNKKLIDKQKEPYLHRHESEIHVNRLSFFQSLHFGCCFDEIGNTSRHP
jgi:hypothetical protein